MGKKSVCAFSGCGRKLTLADQATVCKCELTFCSHHRHFNDHSCTFDFKTQEKTLLGKNLGKCVAQKVESF